MNMIRISGFKLLGRLCNVARQVEDGRVLADLAANFAGRKIVWKIEEIAVGWRLHLAVGAKGAVFQQLEIGCLVVPLLGNVFRADTAWLEDQISNEAFVRL